MRRYLAKRIMELQKISERLIHFDKPTRQGQLGRQNHGSARILTNLKNRDFETNQ